MLQGPIESQDTEVWRQRIPPVYFCNVLNMYATTSSCFTATSLSWWEQTRRSCCRCCCPALPQASTHSATSSALKRSSHATRCPASAFLVVMMMMMMRAAVTRAIGELKLREWQHAVVRDCCGLQVLRRSVTCCGGAGERSEVKKQLMAQVTLKHSSETHIYRRCMGVLCSKVGVGL